MPGLEQAQRYHSDDVVCTNTPLNIVSLWRMAKIAVDNTNSIVERTYTGQSLNHDSYNINASRLTLGHDVYLKEKVGTVTNTSSGRAGLALPT